jgi:hypothetical protein
MLMASTGALAQATRTWVSGVGDDANPCSRTAPCKTFAGAISKTAVNGIINVLDPGGFGAVTITKNITIDGSGGSIAGVLGAGTNGININAAGIRVILRNLDIEGGGSGFIGVNMVQGTSLTIENCRIYGFQSGSATGLRVSLTGSADVVVRDSNISDSATGVQLETTSGTLTATLDNVRIDNTSVFALQTANVGQVQATIRRSTLSNNALNAVQASGPGSVINIVDSLLSFNDGTSVRAAYPGSRIRISGNTIVYGGTGLAIASGGAIESDGTNRISGFAASAAPNAIFNNQ